MKPRSEGTAQVKPRSEASGVECASLAAFSSVRMPLFDMSPGATQVHGLCSPSLKACGSAAAPIVVLGQSTTQITEVEP